AGGPPARRSAALGIRPQHHWCEPLSHRIGHGVDLLGAEEDRLLQWRASPGPFTLSHGLSEMSGFRTAALRIWEGICRFFVTVAGARPSFMSCATKARICIAVIAARLWSPNRGRRWFRR